MFLNLLINLILLFFWGRSDLPAATYNTAETIFLEPHASVVTIDAEKAAVLEDSGRFWLYEKKANEVQPIASITKLMTALIFLNNNPGWDQVYKINETDEVEGGRVSLFPGEEVRVKDLFYTSLIASDNGATMALVHSTGLSEEEFVSQMNLAAKKMGLIKTSFFDPTGLSDKNVSSAREVAKLAKIVFAQAEVGKVTEKKEYTFKTLSGVEKKVESTDYLLFDPAQNSFQVLGGKTGYTPQAGYCFVGLFKDSSGQEIISVVLNSFGKNERFKESKALVNWVFKNYHFSK